MTKLRPLAIWAALLAITLVPALLAAQSPLLAWRDAIYVTAGFAGIAALGLMLFQPLLAAGRLPGVALPRSRRLHRWIGVAVLAAVVIHVGGLWITSPPDVIDALLFTSPTPFSAWGVIAMWALVATALIAAMRRRFRQNLRLWRALHTLLACIIVAGTVIHTVQIIGTMETLSKLALCAAVVLALIKAVSDLRGWGRSRSAR